MMYPTPEQKLDQLKNLLGELLGAAATVTSDRDMAILVSNLELIVEKCLDVIAESGYSTVVKGISGALYVSDEEVARKVRMLTRFDVDHEFICVLARDRIIQLSEAVKESVKLQSHYARLLNTYDGGQRLQFDTVESWMERLALVKTKPTLDQKGDSD